MGSSVGDCTIQCITESRGLHEARTKSTFSFCVFFLSFFPYLCRRQMHFVQPRRIIKSTRFGRVTRSGQDRRRSSSSPKACTGVDLLRMIGLIFDRSGGRFGLPAAIASLPLLIDNLDRPAQGRVPGSKLGVHSQSAPTLAMSRVGRCSSVLGLWDMLIRTSPRRPD